MENIGFLKKKVASETGMILYLISAQNHELNFYELLSFRMLIIAETTHFDFLCALEIIETCSHKILSVRNLSSNASVRCYTLQL